MRDNIKGLERINVDLAWAPADLNGAGATGDYVCLKHYRRCVFLLLMGDGTAGQDITLSVYQATSNAGAGAKVLDCLETGRIYTKYAATYALYAALAAWTKVTQATADEQYADTTNGEVVGITALEIRSEDLDVTGGFDHIRVDASDPGASKVAAGLYVLLDPVYPDEPTQMKDAKGN